MNIRQLTTDDWSLYKQVRLKALKECPEAFGSSYEEEAEYSENQFKEMLAQNDLFGVFEGEALIAMAGYFTLKGLKTKHRGFLFGLYVEPQFRNQSVASKLLLDLLRHAKSKMSQIHLSVVTTNEAALKLYKKHGFEIYGTEPHSLKIGESFFDEYLMALQFE